MLRIATVSHARSRAVFGRATLDGYRTTPARGFATGPTSCDACAVQVFFDVAALALVIIIEVHLRSAFWRHVLHFWHMDIRAASAWRGRDGWQYYQRGSYASDHYGNTDDPPNAPAPL